MIDIKAFGLTILCRVLNASYEVMVSERCRAHPVVERPRSLQPPFNDDAVTPPNFQFRFAITFRPCYFTPRADSAIMFHHIDREFISKEKVLPVFYRKTEPFILTYDKVYFGTCNRQTVEYSKLRTCAPIC